MNEKTLVLKGLDGMYFKGFGTFGCEFTKNKKEAKKYAGEHFEILDDECHIEPLVFPAYYNSGEFVHK